MRTTVNLIDALAIIQGETYRELITNQSIQVPGDWSAGTPRGQIRTDIIANSGTLLAEFLFESSTYDAESDTTTLKPYLTDEQTTAIAPTTYKAGRTPSVRNCYVADFEIELNGDVAKIAYGFVQVIGEVTGTGIPPVNTTETFLADPGNGTTGQLLARASDNKGDVTWVNTGHGGLLDADTLDGQEGTYYQDRANHTGTQAISTIDGLQTALDGKEPADATILKSAAIGVTVQGYNANTVIDANYVATENSYTTTEKNKLAGIENNATADQTAAEILTAIKTVDGTGSGLDADTVDGLESTAFATAAQGTLADSAVQPAAIANFETTTQLNTRDTNNRNRTNHTGTQTASTISDFDTEVSNNTDVAANTSARHVAVTVVDSSEIDLTLTGQQISASLVAGSIDETKLDTSVNASLDLADTSLQPADIGITVQGYSANTVIDSAYVHTDNNYTTTEKNKLAGIADGAEVNVQSDWNAVSGDSQILNKPTLGTAAATDSTDYATAAQGALADTALQPSALENTTLTGIPTAPTAPSGTNTTQIATTAFVLANAGVDNGVVINGVANFWQPTAPTQRIDESPLQDGDTWYNPTTQMHSYRKSLYWVSGLRFLTFYSFPTAFPTFYRFGLCPKNIYAESFALNYQNLSEITSVNNHVFTVGVTAGNGASPALVFSTIDVFSDIPIESFSNEYSFLKPIDTAYLGLEVNRRTLSVGMTKNGTIGNPGINVSFFYREIYV